MSESKTELNSLEISVQNDYMGDPTPEEVDDEMEEGEASEDEVEVNVIVGNTKTNNSIHDTNNSKNERAFRDFDDGIEAISDNTIDDKIDVRSHRFGEVSKPGYLSRENLHTLYKSLNLCEDDFNRGGWRMEALLVKGISKQTKQDIYNYFEDFSPKYLEWLSKDECNVVFEKSAAAALYNMSCPIQPKDKPHDTIRINIDNTINQPILAEKEVAMEKEKSESSDSSSSESEDSSDSDSDSSSDSEDDSSSSSDSNSSSSDGSSSSDEEMEEGETYGPEVPPKQDEVPKTVENMAAATDIGVDVPTGGRWRLGVPFPGAKAVFMRFAHCKDNRVLGLKNTIEIFDSTTTGKSTNYNEAPNWREDKIAEDSKLFSRLGRKRQMEMPPMEPRRRPPVQPMFDDPENYKDLDDPIDGTKDPWGFLAQNWTSKETQNSLDYQALLRDHVFNKSDTRKRVRSEYESEEPRQPKFRRSSAAKPRVYMQAPYNYSEESDASDDVVEWNSKVKIPRMKMYADDEEKKQKRRVPSPRRSHIDDRHIYADSPMRKRFDLRQKLSRKIH